MPARTLHLALPGPDATAALARRIGAGLRPGDVLLLDGPVGAGKTHFARSLIQSLLPVPEDVPSPTFTLVQTYEGAGFDIWHTDLYRLSSTEEVIELGLLEAFDHSVTLVEWPDRLGALVPTNALTLAFAPHDDPDQRVLDITWRDPRWDDRAGEFSA
ncbi:MULTISPECIES: tRNA (adenosine(37)-N6)-threonylcarbamoyltransferase complex ATPase subunit type 1 TsaE [unclassified Roseovarius]|uniref:tRNA (adenosine(37)-N6)-threonylcarbamoyltransferase complex ATPase subunit type 1 TsaE n=1 Tax=unclassified Roseovarius TaxID=2614913 RepID=UPI00273E52E6|nr:tRNA (adenosine(37)-N6)-threonylcarbamoyltransferase complex ATPase subunit type 1 TsaE [Roseovarius sp. MMSF_3350]